MQKPNIVSLSVLSVVFIFVAVSVVMYYEGNLTGEVSSSAPIEVPAAGYAGYHGWTQPGDYASSTVKVTRSVPGVVMIPNEIWNFGTLNEILNAAMTRLTAARSAGRITGKQFELLQVELFNIQQSIGVCVGDADAKTMIRSRYGGSGTAFSELYPKMMTCMIKKMAEAKAAKPATVEPMQVPKTAFDYEWTLFVYGNIVQQGKLDLFDYKGTLWLPVESEPEEGTMEVVTTGFTFRTPTRLIDVDGIRDPENEQFEIRTGMITYNDGSESPLIIRRLK
ncbi:hypothetical protein KY329_01360 [Candidatus Woesearchaeota archaeon]|nr:hypothetical protein [Candidatus Woesearchaeota archaeon]